ncbi:hypothetical protein B0T11DRAFT_355494, partial [Plectosphaerella cucumerina]
CRSRPSLAACGLPEAPCQLPLRASCGLLAGVQLSPLSSPRPRSKQANKRGSAPRRTCLPSWRHPCASSSARGLSGRGGRPPPEGARCRSRANSSRRGARLQFFRQLARKRCFPLPGLIPEPSRTRSGKSVLPKITVGSTCRTRRPDGRAVCGSPSPATANMSTATAALARRRPRGTSDLAAPCTSVCAPWRPPQEETNKNTNSKPVSHHLPYPGWPGTPGVPGRLLAQAGEQPIVLRCGTCLASVSATPIAVSESLRPFSWLCCSPAL